MPKSHFKETYRIASNRLSNYDYSSDGWYFVTICTQNREDCFGEIVDDHMILNDRGKIVNDEIIATNNIRKNVTIDEFIIMPNHVHLIMVIVDRRRDAPAIMKNAISVETHCNASLQQPDGLHQNTFGPQRNNLGSIIRGLKGSITNKINNLYRNDIDFAWQSNYYDHVIRNDDELAEIRQYIINNPLQWELDKDNKSGLYI